MESGSDVRRMGRWCWTKYRGKDETIVIIVMVYRVGRGKSNPTATMTAYAQQRRIINEVNEDRTPQDVMIEDLCTEVTKWQQQGEKIILMGDWNRKIDSTKKWVKQLEAVGMREASKHKYLGELSATYNRGREPIDGLFLSENIQDFQMGYLAFGEVPMGADHRCGWIDIKYSKIFGKHLPPLISPKARRLKTQDPRVTKQYLKLLSEYCSGHQMGRRINELEQKTKTTWSHTEEETYEQIDKDLTESMLKDEKAVEN